MALVIDTLLLHALTLVACFNVYSADGLRILGLFPFQGKSHFVTCEELMRGLAARGHQVDVYSHFPLKEPVPNYTDFSLKGSLFGLVNNLTYNEIQNSAPPKMISNMLTIYGNQMCELLGHPHFQKLLHDPPNDPPYDLIIHEVCMAYCYLPWARRLNIPMIGVVTMPILDWLYEALGNPYNIATDTRLFAPYVAPATFFERLSNVITNVRVMHAFNYYAQEQDIYVEKFFGPGYPNVIDLQKDISLLLINYDQALNGIRPFLPSIVPVGGLHIIDRNETLPKDVQIWLDESKDGCVYFSFGSMLRIETLPTSVLDPLYRTFKNIAPVRVLLKIAKPKELPAGLPANVMTQPWLPQIQVLKHKNVKAFVTHGGLMGTQESIYFGVPMVGVPLFADQHQNVDSYVKKKISVKVNVNEITEETFTNALQDILNNTVYKKATEKISREIRDRPISPLDNAVFWIEYISRHGKDALRSPVIDLSWWQAALLDVYAFIVAVTVLALWISTIMLKKFFRFFLLKLRQYLSLKVKGN